MVGGGTYKTMGTNILCRNSVHLIILTTPLSSDRECLRRGTGILGLWGLSSLVVWGHFY